MALLVKKNRHAGTGMDFIRQKKVERWRLQRTGDTRQKWTSRNAEDVKSNALGVAATGRYVLISIMQRRGVYAACQKINRSQIKIGIKIKIAFQPEDAVC